MVAAVPGKIRASTLKCAFCNRRDLLEPSASGADSMAKSTILALFKVLVDMPSFNGLHRPRVTAMTALRRLATHSKDPAFLDLESSSVGLWCMKSLSSSNRELRIAARYGAFLHRARSNYLN